MTAGNDYASRKEGEICTLTGRRAPKLVVRLKDSAAIAIEQPLE